MINLNLVFYTPGTEQDPNVQLRVRPNARIHRILRLLIAEKCPKVSPDQLLVIFKKRSIPVDDEQIRFSDLEIVDGSSLNILATLMSTEDHQTIPSASSASAADGSSMLGNQWKCSCCQNKFHFYSDVQSIQPFNRQRCSPRFACQSCNLVLCERCRVADFLLHDAHHHQLSVSYIRSSVATELFGCRIRREGESLWIVEDDEDDTVGDSVTAKRTQQPTKKRRTSTSNQPKPPTPAVTPSSSENHNEKDGGFVRPLNPNSSKPRGRPPKTAVTQPQPPSSIIELDYPTPAAHTFAPPPFFLLDQDMSSCATVQPSKIIVQQTTTDFEDEVGLHHNINEILASNESQNLNPNASSSIKITQPSIPEPAAQPKVNPVDEIKFPPRSQTSPSSSSSSKVPSPSRPNHFLTLGVHDPVKAQQDKIVPTAKRRGRPRKNPVVDEKSQTITCHRCGVYRLRITEEECAKRQFDKSTRDALLNHLKTECLQLMSSNGDKEVSRF